MKVMSTLFSIFVIFTLSLITSIPSFFDLPAGQYPFLMIQSACSCGAIFLYFFCSRRSLLGRAPFLAALLFCVLAALLFCEIRINSTIEPQSLCFYVIAASLTIMDIIKSMLLAKFLQFLFGRFSCFIMIVFKAMSFDPEIKMMVPSGAPGTGSDEGSRWSGSWIDRWMNHADGSSNARELEDDAGTSAQHPSKENVETSLTELLQQHTKIEPKFTFVTSAKENLKISTSDPERLSKLSQAITTYKGLDLPEASARYILDNLLATMKEWDASRGQ